MGQYPQKQVLPQIFQQNNSDIMLQPYHQYPETKESIRVDRDLDIMLVADCLGQILQHLGKCRSNKTQFSIKDILVNIQNPIN